MASDPLTPLAGAAVQMHEFVVEYQAAGFSRGEAVQIVIALVAATMRPQEGKP